MIPPYFELPSAVTQESYARELKYRESHVRGGLLMSNVVKFVAASMAMVVVFCCIKAYLG